MVKVYKSQLESLIDREDITRKTEINRMQTDIEKFVTRQTNLQNSFLDGDITSSDYNEMKSRIESELHDNRYKVGTAEGYEESF